jgi:hypothetical protein
VAAKVAPAPPDATQLPLFETARHPVLTELGALDLNSVSPLEALNQLAAWKRRLEQV